MSGLLASTLLCAAYGVALAFAPRRAIPPALLLMAIIGVLASLAPVRPGWRETIVLTAAISTAATALAVHLPNGLRSWQAGLLAINTGVWAGASAAMEMGARDVLLAQVWALLCIPGAWFVSTGKAVVLKVVASWLLAIALLTAALPVLVETPGYVADHAE